MKFTTVNKNYDIESRTRPSITLADLPSYHGGDVKSAADVLEWRMKISQVTAAKSLPCPYLTASSLLSLSDLRRYLINRKEDLDQDFAKSCRIQGVSASALGQDILHNMSDVDAFSGTFHEISGDAYASPFVFDYEFYMFFEEMPMKLDYDLRLVDVVRSVWDPTKPFELYFRSIGRGDVREALALLEYQKL